MRAYSSFRQLEADGLCVDDYHFNESEGVFTARLDFKRWGKKKNIFGYFTFEDGSKVVACTWCYDNYLGMPDIAEGTSLTLTFKKSKSGISYLREIKKNDGQ